MEIGTVRQIDIDHEMQGAYLDYAMSVIVARALPDVRDGLKPVHRRILYAMHDMGLTADKPYKKSARIVGEVLGKYHPHGDAAVYDAMARMAQDFSLRYMLVDGQGNFGSIDGDSPAAMRYTEARLSAIAGQMLADIDKDTVAFVSNFDDTLSEPAVLPALLPNLLVNGASGIAVGMTTNVPPHNLAEVCDALVFLIDHYARLDDVTVEDLTRFIQGPDFPTGGVVYRYGGAEENGDRTDLIRNAYALGRGHMTVQAHVHIEEMSRNRSRIVVTELPYQVSKSRLIERIAELVRDGRIDGIADLRDESDRQGMRVCVELTRTVEARDVLSQLFKLTPMQATFGLRMLALVDGEPRLLPLKRVLTLYLEHRQEIITRRSRYLLEKARLRAHILEGLLKALDQIDEVIALIRRSQTADTARKNLMERLQLTEVQADAILEMPLKRLAALERRKIADEYKEKLAEIKQLQELLRNPAKVRGAIKEELLALKARHGDARRTRIVDREKGHHTARDLVEAQDVLVTLWREGQLQRSAAPPHLSAQAVPVGQVWADTRDDVAVLTAGGQAGLVPLHQLAEGEGVALAGLTALPAGDPPAGLAVTRPPREGEAGYLTLATRQGRIKRVALDDFAAAAGRGAVTAIGLDPGDRLVWAAVTSGDEQVLLVTRQGQAIRFAEEEVRPMGLPAAGVLAVKLAADDAVVGAGLARDDQFVVTLSELGYAKRTPVRLFPAQKRYGGGVQAAKLTARTGKLAAAAVAGEERELVLATARGRAVQVAVKAVAAAGRAAPGERAPQGRAEPYLDPAKHGPAVSLAVLAGARPGAGNPGTEGPKPARRKAAPSGAEEGDADKPATRGKVEDAAGAAEAPAARRKKPAADKPADAPPAGRKKPAAGKPAEAPATGRKKAAAGKPADAPAAGRKKPAADKPADAPAAGRKKPAADKPAEAPASPPTGRGRRTSGPRP